MLIIFFRSILLYLCILIALRIMGKGEIAEMNTFDLVITLLLADVASIPMENNNVPLIYGIAAITGLTLLQTLISFLSLKFKKFDSFICGAPTILVDKGQINQNSLKKERITINELLEQLRIAGFFNLKDVQYAILEADGTLSVLPSPNYQDIPSKELKHLPISIIVDGILMKNNLAQSTKDTLWLEGVLNANHIKNIKEVLLLVLDGNDKVFIQKK
ncbi:MAG: DUF421 domain-containing protein [Peptostreptococcaceae bacterium]